MNNWLYERITENDGNRKPSFSVQATYNWFRALRFEIKKTHGQTSEEQFASCREFYKIAPRNKNEYFPDDVFEPLFFSVIYSMTLERFSKNLGNVPWVRPTAVVDWYYAIYFSIRSTLPAFGRKVADDHSKTAKFFASTFRTNFPYPLNMIAQRKNGEQYGIYLLDDSEKFYDLNRTFVGMRSVAQGMLSQYLKGTADWYAGRTKINILEEQKGAFLDFRSKKAREIRDRRLIPEIGFLHCAFRQRVKANYRDAIYLSYDYGEVISLDSFIECLSFTAKFVSIAAMTLLERRLGKDILHEFAKDLRTNLRGIDIATDSEKYWQVFL